MKVKPAQIARALDAPDGTIRLYLLYGQDDPGARALGARLESAMGPDAERIDLDGAILKADPARLADEAAAISLFGTKRHIRVEGGDECAPAVDALLGSTTAGDPVVMIAGNLKATGALLKRALDDPKVLACPLYQPSASDLATLAEALGRPIGVRLGRGVGIALATSSLGDRAVIERELEKIGLYLDAAPDRPREATLDTLAAIGAALGEAEPGRLVDAVLSGHLSAATKELAELDGSSGWIPALRALSRRLIMLARLRAEVESGKSAAMVVRAQGRSIFFKDEEPITAQLGRWPAAKLAIAQARVTAIEAALFANRSAGDIIAAQGLIDIARVAERLR
ncbi:MAG: DNA polymerase III subunit delta [Sphingomonadaceae bacterium]